VYTPKNVHTSNQQYEDYRYSKLRCQSPIQLKVLKLSVAVGEVSIILKCYVASLDD